MVYNVLSFRTGIHPLVSILTVNQPFTCITFATTQVPVSLSRIRSSAACKRSANPTRRTYKCARRSWQFKQMAMPANKLTEGANHMRCWVLIEQHAMAASFRALVYDQDHPLLQAMLCLKSTS